MMSLGITAWVTSRKWTLGPSYVNNSRVIETLPSPSLVSVHLLPPAPVTEPRWPPDHFRRPGDCDRVWWPHRYQEQRSSVIGWDTITVFCHNYPLHHERLLVGRGIRATKNKQRRGMCCYLWHRTMGPGLVTNTDDHWSPALRSAWERRGDMLWQALEDLPVIMNCQYPAYC